MENKSVRQMSRLIFLVLFTSSVLSQSSTYDFLRINVGSRASGLAGSFTAMLDDPTLIFYNPAGLTTIKNSYAVFGYLKYLLDINLGYAAYTQQYKNLGYIGAGLIYINYGNFKRMDKFGNQIGTFSAMELAGILGYANQDDNLKYGVNLKLIYSSIAGARSAAIAVDIGTMYMITSQNLNIAITLSNIGVQLKRYAYTGESLPFEVRFAVSKQLEHLPLRLNINFNKLNEQTSKIAERFKNFVVGGEFTITDNLKLRFGYDNEKRRELKINPSVDLTGFSFGLGLKISDYRFDYSLTSLGRIGSLHQISITFLFR
jgi:hypothetical protein